MSIYLQKQRWKILLFLAAVLIVLVSLWYTNRLVNKISQEERNKVTLWAEAIQKKAKLVNYTGELFKKITTDERKKVELWAEATKQLANSQDISDYSFALKVITDNTTVPVILTDEGGNVISSRNLDSAKANDQEYLQQSIKFMWMQHDPIEINIFNGQKNFIYYQDSKLFAELKTIMDDLIKSFISEVVVNSASVPVIFTDSTQTKVVEFGNLDSAEVYDPEALADLLAEMEDQNPAIEVSIGAWEKGYIFYKDSFLLTQLKYYPFVQLGIIGIFLIVAYTLFSIARKSEQNQVWVGMAKETAHQLGTPLSSLMAWVEYLKGKGIDMQTIGEMDKDVQRLETITERFSKIGSEPKLEKEDILAVLKKSIAYLKTRTSKNVTFQFATPADAEIKALVNVPLFDWVIENLCRNAVDAMEGNGSITIEVTDERQYAYIDISDTGAGIPKGKYKTIFEPGFTTKQRGWGLGLSLTKRIIENYHDGKIFVLKSELGIGTTFRIVLNK